MENNNISQTNSGLYQDDSPNNQPKGTYRFALNSVNETELGDFGFIGNEESNKECFNIKANYIPIGKVYLNNNEVLLFLVSSDETISEIALLDNNCNYVTIVNDALSSNIDKLNFKVSHQIQAKYRLRLGCEQTVYFTDDYNKPRYFNLNSLADFKNPDGTWSGRKFNLFKDYSSTPEFDNIEVLNSGGILEPGSYNIAVQYLDEGLNPSEWITTSEVVHVYNDLTTSDYLDIRGSINSDVDYLNFPRTTKSIRVTLDNLDNSYIFYRLAFIEATSGTGFVTAVKYSEVIPVEKNYYIYTGENAAGQGTEEEIAFFNNIIYRAGSIEQIENRLILANTQGKQVNYCDLQKYASRIKADCITKKVILNNITDPRNPKNPSMQLGDMVTGGLGYMPGEIYSFGIVYIFDDGSLSPVFHIPGKNNNINPGTIFSPGLSTYPMNNTNNSSASNVYIDNDSCSNNNYWGADSEGVLLLNQPVRHHRFPFRSEINVDLVKEETLGGENEFTYYQLQLLANGEITLPEDCPLDPDTGFLTNCAPPFEVRITYTIDGLQDDITFIMDPGALSNPINETRYSNLFSSNNIVIIKIEESSDGVNYTDVTSGDVSPKGLSYSADVVNQVFTSEEKLYSSEILGIKFSGVDIPTLEDTNGQNIIGYYIVRNERVENEKTILDSAVLTSSLINDKYISHGLLNPEIADNKISKKVFGLIYPENKFNKKEYQYYDYLKQEGVFNIIKTNKSKIRYNDVLDGSSYNSDSHKRGNDDGRGLDGWCLSVIIRDNYTQFSRNTTFNLDTTDIEQTFYLKALESRNINDGANTVYNIASDNRIGIVQTKEDLNTSRLPYVIMGREILDSYSNFRTLPYYKQSLNMVNATSSTAICFSGDSYVSPMRYVNTVFWENRPAKRAGRTSLGSFIAGALLIVIGALAAFFTAGATTLLIGAGISLIGAGALFVASGIEKDALARAYSDEYNKGLRETALDSWVQSEYGKGRPNSEGGSGPSDDDIEWIGDSITDLWFDTSVNTALRHGMVTDLPTFLPAPGVQESGNQQAKIVWEFFGLYYENAISRYPVSKLEFHLANKLLTFDSSRKDNRAYLGAALGEYYEINPDYHRYNKQKLFYHLPLEYNCCSDCMEDFPHRVHYSEQSFQEELTDNYRIFLPNNYKDIDGETGEIKNLFKISNDLFIHTLEGLWQMPRSYQERVTDQIVSFIGTGSYFEIPPRKIVDDDSGNSAGLQHKWSTIKTPSGYFFVCENQRKIYQFDGRSLKVISNIGLSNYFKENTELLADKAYYNTHKKKYKYNDNPSNLLGTGFISTYDTKKERLIFTKKDFIFSEEVLNEDSEICVNNNTLISFPNFQDTINTEALDGWIYTGLENCVMKFKKDILLSRTETREVITTIPSDAIVIPFFDTTSMGAGIIANISTTLDAWFPVFKASINGGVNNITFINPGTWNQWGTENWVNDPAQLVLDNVGTNKDVILLVFVDESNPIFHGSTQVIPMEDPTTGYISSANNFVDVLHPQFSSFIAINYPVVQNTPVCKVYLNHAIAAIEAKNLSLTEVNALQQNPNFTTPQWDLLKLNLQNNTYTGQPVLKDYGWFYKENRVTGVGNNTTPGCPSDGVSVITPCSFTQDIQDLIGSTTTVETIEVEVFYIETIYKYIEGEIIDNPVEYDTSWTMSYSQKANRGQGSWISWHSYLPSFYIDVPEKFYSWNRTSNIYKHNITGDYQKFYGILYPHILEYISLSNPLVTRIWNHIELHTQAKVYKPNFNEYVEDRDTTFNKLITYNSRQCSGLLDLTVKDNMSQQDFFSNQTINNNDNSVVIDRREKDWFINDLRDIRIDYSIPIWDSSIATINTNNSYIDKVLNVNSLSLNKPWTQLENFRDKYLVIRLIFDNFADVETLDKKLITNYSIENETQSFT